MIEWSPKIIQALVSITLLCVWLLRFGRPTSFRGGKAKNLKRRVSSYFQGSRRFVRAQPKIAAMVEMVREISVHQTRSETEALLLEGKLIKQYKPRYNTDFTDDKQFLLVQVDLQNKLPRFRLCRNKKEDGSHYFSNTLEEHNRAKKRWKESSIC